MPGFLTELPLTEKGRVTRERIVDAAADLMVERGAWTVSLNEVGRVTCTSKSQMYHYFASRDQLIAAVVICVRDRILAFQSHLLEMVESVDDLRGWADSIVAVHRRGSRWTGCPLGTLSSELMGVAEVSRLELQDAFGSWQLLLGSQYITVTSSTRSSLLPLVFESSSCR